MKPFRAVFTTIVITAIVLFMLLGIFLPGSKPAPQVDVKAALPQNNTLPPETPVTDEKTVESLPAETSDTKKPKEAPFHLKLPNGYSLTMTRLREYDNRYTKYVIKQRGKVAWRSPAGLPYDKRWFPGEDSDTYYFLDVNTEKCPDLVKPGEDITGNGVPDLVIGFSTNGAHCCYTFHVFELGPKLRLLATFEVGDAGESHFEKRKDEKGLLFVTNDYTFTYKLTSFAGSPAPEVILRFSNGKYRLADDLMRKPPLSRKKLREIAQAVQSDEQWENSENLPLPASIWSTPTLLWSTMLDLIYTGNEKVAWDFFEKAWPRPRNGKQSSLREFQEVLFSSQYWPQIREMNRGQE
ncbi:MAG: hypothetical protein AB7U43_02455 [Desulfobacter sp.]